MTILPILLAVLTLDGVTGRELTARASFDANNVRVGDPMTLTIDFIGSAEFADLHPPALSREVDARTWKVDDASAKTETYRNARRLAYRVRPLREGLWEFPALDFTYDGGAVRTRAIPVHVKPGVQAALGLEEPGGARAMPDGLLCAVEGLSDDEAFRWRRACNRPTAEAFAAFDFPEARLNEAACHLLDGNWAKAMNIYSRLEWRIGMTPTIERGILAAKGELPAWRLALRPVLRHGWRGRVGLLGGGVLALAALMWLCGRLVRALAAVGVALALVTLPAAAQSPFDAIDRMHEQMMQRMNEMMNGMGGAGGLGGMTMTINGQQAEPLEVTASLALSTNDVRVGETFRYIVSVEAPRGVTLDQLRLTPSEMFGMVTMGKVEALTDGEGANPSNRVRRLAIPVRYDVPFKGAVSMRVEGMAARRQRMGGSSFSFSQNFAVESPELPVEIKPLPTDNQPPDFSGAIGTDFRLTQSADRTRVETNDVVRVTNVLAFSGYLPPGAVPDEVDRQVRQVAWQRYFVADGSREVPAASLVYYDTQTRTYRRVASKPTPLTYVAPEEDAEDATRRAVAVDASDSAPRAVRPLRLRFAPSEDSPVVETVQLSETDAPLRETERRGDWVRLDSGRHAGWVPLEN